MVNESGCEDRAWVSADGWTAGQACPAVAQLGGRERAGKVAQQFVVPGKHGDALPWRGILHQNEG